MILHTSKWSDQLRWFENTAARAAGAPTTNLFNSTQFYGLPLNNSDWKIVEQAVCRTNQ